MSGRFDLARFIATYGTALAAIAVFVIFAATAPNFLNPTNLLNILKQISFLAILGLGFGLIPTFLNRKQPICSCRVGFRAINICDIVHSQSGLVKAGSHFA